MSACSIGPRFSTASLRPVASIPAPFCVTRLAEDEAQRSPRRPGVAPGHSGRQRSAAPAGQLLYDLSGGRAPLGQQRQEVVDTSAASSTTRLPSAHSARWSRAAAVSSAASSISLRPAAGEPPAARHPRRGRLKTGAGVGVADGSGRGCPISGRASPSQPAARLARARVLPLVRPCAMDPRFVYDSPL